MDANGCKWLKMAENGSKMPQKYTVDGRQEIIEMSPKQKFYQNQNVPKTKILPTKFYWDFPNTLSRQSEFGTDCPGLVFNYV